MPDANVAIVRNKQRVAIFPGKVQPLADFGRKVDSAATTGGESDANQGI
jgi:hypothetical protein